MRGLSILLFAAQILAVTAAHAASWVKFNDPNGHASVEFPIAPTATSATVTNKFGQVSPRVDYGVTEDNNKVGMLLMVIDFTKMNITDQVALDQAVAAAASAFNLQTTDTITIDGYPGRYLAGIEPKSGVHFTDKLSFVDHHLYQAITTVEDPSADDASDVKRFSDSLHFAQ